MVLLNDDDWWSVEIWTSVSYILLKENLVPLFHSYPSYIEGSILVHISDDVEEG